MASSEQSPEQRELSLIGKVELRIALADTDAKLTTILATYLAPLLLKLASEHPAVRQKVLAVSQHVTTRVQPATVTLPVKALVAQFKAQPSALVRHFDLLYIQLGVARLSARERGELLPVVCAGIAGSGSHGATIFGLMLRLLEAFVLPLRGSKEDGEMRATMAVEEGDAMFLAEWIGKLILFTSQKAGGATTCPGLTAEDYAFLTMQGKPDVWNPAAGGLNLLRTKVLAAKLLASGLFSDSERFMPALFASADPASTISDVGDDMLKRALPATDLEDEQLIQQLYELYFGGAGRPRVRAPLRLKILGLFNKSTQSTTFANNIMKLVDDGIAPPAMDGEDTVMSNGPVTASTLGREATKLRSAIFSYINFVARYGSHETLHAIASRVVNRLRDFIENQGWPRPGPNEDLVSRGYAYEVIGLLAKAGPRSMLVEEENTAMDLLRWLLTSLAKDSAGNAIVVSIEESLSTVLAAMSRITLAAPEQSALEDLLIDQMEQSADLEAHKRLRSTRYVCVRFANRCLPYASVKARWIDVLGLGATKDRAEVRDEAERGLSPYWYRMLNGSTGAPIADEIAFPAFEDVMAQFFAGHTTSRVLEPAALAQDAARMYSDCFREIVAYSRRALFQEALSKAKVPLEIDSEWERRLDTAVESDIDARGAIKSHLLLGMGQQSQTLETLQSALYECVVGKAQIADDHLVEFLALAPDGLIAKLVPRTDALMPVLQSNNHDRRVAAARAFGILASHRTASREKAQSQIEQLQQASQAWDGAVGAAANRCHGAVVALGYFFSRTAFRGYDVCGTDAYLQLVQTAIKILFESRDSLLKEASFTALGQLAMFNAVTIATIEKTSELRGVVDKIYETAKTGNEAAILCLGQLSMILPEDTSNDDSHLKYVEDRLHKLHEIRQAEVHFTVGEALSYLAAGWRSGALATKLDVEGEPPAGPARASTLEKLTERVLGDCANTKPALKKAAAMWLLCLVQFCGGEPEIQSRLPKCQAAFKRCLSDRDELVQETASRGLGLLYEKGDRRLKDDLVRDLVSSFSSDRQSQLAGTVSEDTQLFEPGALPTGEGQSVSTYKDIMSLAAEVGDQSLVYRFMSMASSNAIWSSRAAFGRFGLSNVLSDSSVDGYLADNPKLYPKLFRYRFDPNGGVQRSMNDIWNALVKDSTATVDKHFDPIMEDLLTSILGKEWRVRQASCAAIADLVSGRPLEKYEQYLERIWTQCFKVMDDIKESVRAAAASLARTLTGVLTRALEADHSSTKNASTMLKHVLPFLLSTSGVESSAKETQAFSIHTLLEIIKKSNGSTLRPHIPELVERFVGLLSSVEPEAVNYIHMNASKYNLTEQKIDDMRLSSVRNSPLMEAIERCIDLLDEDSMRLLQPRLESAMKSAVGLPSKVGSSRVLVSLSTRRMVLYRPYSGDALKLIEKLVLDRNETVSSSYAVAAGYIARGATDKQLLRLFAFAKKLYFESEGDRESVVPRRSLSSGEIMAAVAKYASDRFNALAAAALPFVFVAKHDPSEQVKEQFQNTWNEAVGGSRAVSLYLGEILELCATHLDSQQWALKHTSARTVADAVTAVSSLEAKMAAKSGEQLWPALEKALGGKTWEGKEVVVYAFAKFVETAQAFYTPRPEVKSAITKIALREAKRQNPAYRQHSVKALARIAAAREDMDMSGVVYDAVSPLLQASNADGDKMDVDGQDASRSDEVAEATHVAAIEALFASVNPTVAPGQDLQEALTKAMDAVASMPNRTASVRRALYPSMAKTFDRLGKAADGSRFDVGSLKTLLFGEGVEVEAVRLLRADAIVAATRAAAWLAEEVRSEVEALKSSERSATVQNRLTGAGGGV